MSSLASGNNLINAESLHSSAMLSPELLNGLRRLGLNQYEARAYLALASSGHSTAGEVSEVAEIPRPRAYDVLRGLQEKGFIAMKPGRPVRYYAQSLPDALKSLKRKRQTDLEGELERIEEIGKTLSSKIKSAPAPDRFGVEDRVWTFKGRESIYSKIAGMINGANEHVFISSDAEGLLRKLKASSRELEKAKSRGVKIHLVTPSLPDEARKYNPIHVPVDLPARMVVADDQALFFLTPDHSHPDDEVGMWVHSPHVADTFKQLVLRK